MTTMTSREFNQDAGRAKREAAKGPVFITDRGKPAHVLLTIEDFQKMSVSKKSLYDMVACPKTKDIEFEPEKLQGKFTKAVDFG